MHVESRARITLRGKGGKKKSNDRKERKSIVGRARKQSDFFTETGSAVRVQKKALCAVCQDRRIEGEEKPERELQKRGEREAKEKGRREGGGNLFLKDQFILLYAGRAEKKGIETASRVRKGVISTRAVA